MQLLRAALQGAPEVRLDAAALELAAFERPDLRAEPYLAMLDDMASEVAARLGPAPAGQAFVRVLNQYLFDELGFQGNNSEYYDPGNSCLDQVLNRRTGIPISLSVVYIEVARRLSRPVHGIGLPGHFVVRYDDGVYAAYVDPFHGGRLLTEEDCRELAREITGGDVPEAAWQPVTERYILVRMLNNLREAYFRAKQYAKATVVLDLLLEAFPSEALYFKTRGVARLHLRELTAARSDLEMYLKLTPQADDRAEVTKQLEAIHRWLGRLN
ncbi:MAG: transglutaminase family protein [Acidobacteriales bacterium]|nr:transglutaminase family protein [Terriglobales bacterium]